MCGARKTEWGENMRYYLAIDIGASSGRHILGRMENGKIRCQEIHRFPNGLTERDGYLCWDVDRLFEEILAGMKKCATLCKIPVSVGIDTWGLDYVLLDSDDKRIGHAVGYRDSRTDGVDRSVYNRVPKSELYARTGIQKLSFNTIFQLKADDRLGRAEKLLLIPDYLHYLLCGVSRTEYTNATTTGLVNAQAKDWDWDVIDRCGYPRRIFLPIVIPGTTLGGLLPEIAARVGYDCKVVLPATHDTGSAVAAVPSTAEDILYISSGTWSLMGVERAAPDCTPESAADNFTNEGGVDYRFRYLKNIMGLWMIQCVKAELNDIYSFARLCEMAAEARISSIVDCNHSRFLAPESMIAELQAACKESGQPVPTTPGQLAAVIYNSLAKCYADTARDLETRTGKTYDWIHIVGGGSNAVWLNELTAKVTGKTVLAGPGEATAIGNIGAQMIQAGVFPDLKAFRKSVETSFDVKTYRA